MTTVLKANEHTRIKLSKTIALVVLAGSLALVGGALYEGRDSIAGGLAYADALIPPWVQTSLLLAVIAASAVLGWRFAADLLPRLKREWAQGRVDGATFRSTGGTYYVNTEAHPSAAKDKVLPAWITSSDSPAAHDVVAWLTDDQDLMGGKDSMRMTRDAMRREFPTNAVGAHAAEGKDMRVSEREKVMGHVANLLKVREEYRALLITLAFSNVPDRSNTLTTVNEEFAKDFARLPTKALFFEINTRSAAAMESPTGPCEEAEEPEAASGPWYASADKPATPKAASLPIETAHGSMR